jgi:hypothetical protein
MNKIYLVMLVMSFLISLSVYAQATGEGAASADSVTCACNTGCTEAVPPPVSAPVPGAPPVAPATGVTR